MTLKQATSRQQRCRTRPLLKVVDAEALPAKTTALNPPQAIVTTVATIVEDVFRNGEAALRRWAFDLGDLQARDASLLIDAAQCRAALTSLAEEDRHLLERAARRIEAFATTHRRALGDLHVKVPGGSAGIRYQPVERVACYAPGGRFPLPSSVLMTALTARAAEVEQVWVVSPKPAPITLAAAAVAGADGVFAVGGAQAIAAAAAGVGMPACDVIVGPGNAWVTEAKRQLAGTVRIDMLAGPSELLVLAGKTASAKLVAADLLAQAEHDPLARPMLACTSAMVLTEVESALQEQLNSLPTRSIAEAALGQGWACVVLEEQQLVDIANNVAPEHLALHGIAPAREEQIRHAGAVFKGEMSAEVFADYGVGPNHVLPTGGRARANGGLTVLDFLRPRPWLDARPPDEVIDDVAGLARLEGLEAHARAALLRRRQP